MILADTVIEFAIRPDGWFHSIQGGFDVPRGPVGVLFYLAFVPPFWLMPTRWRAHYLTATSLLLTVVTVGPAFAVMLAVLALAGFAIIRALGNDRGYALGATLLVGSYAAIILHPQPGWLPPVSEPLFFYVHWAGIAYMFLKTLHVLNDLSRRKLAPPYLSEWLAYILFAPSLRMGPMYRYDEFSEQLRGDLAAHRQLGRAVGRIVSGLVRLGVLGALLDKPNFPLDVLFGDPGQWSPTRFILGVYLAPMCAFLWFSGYVELGVGIGRAMGFVVPENFNYPWIAVNIGEFWQRWHMTLGSWLRDYIFTPLVRRRWHFFWAFTLTFFLCGLWHSNRWCYVIWGTAQGVGLAVLRIWTHYWKRQRTAGTPLYRRLAAVRLVNSPITVALAWLLTFHYEVVTILIGMDIQHAGKLVAFHAWELLRNAF